MPKTKKKMPKTKKKQVKAKNKQTTAKKSGARKAARPSPATIRFLLNALDKTYPDATCALEFKNPLQLLVATILSAQCTDTRVNMVTKDLFKKYKTPDAYADAPEGELENDIRSTGFFNNKAKSIRGAAAALRDRFSGRVPSDMEALLSLPGVARKTANVVLGTAFGIPSGVVVDTHVRRISQRLGLTQSDKPEKIEQDLIELIPKDKWIAFSHCLIRHGRKICSARKPNCNDCPLAAKCPSCGTC